MINEYEEVGGTRIGRGNRSTRRKPAPEPLRPPQNPHDDLRSNPDRRCGKPTTNCLSYRTIVCLFITNYCKIVYKKESNFMTIQSVSCRSLAWNMTTIKLHQYIISLLCEIWRDSIFISNESDCYQSGVWYMARDKIHQYSIIVFSICFMIYVKDKSHQYSV
jgi:hypothetical protein